MTEAEREERESGRGGDEPGRRGGLDPYQRSIGANGCCQAEHRAYREVTQKRSTHGEPPVISSGQRKVQQKRV